MQMQQYLNTESVYVYHGVFLKICNLYGPIWAVAPLLGWIINGNHKLILYLISDIPT
jgi:hypothetical protein